MARNICETENCGEPISELCGSRGGLAICAKCRHVQYYWKKQGPKALAHRRDMLEFWVGRIDYLTPHIGRLIREAKQRVSTARASASHHIHH
jgi:hypothetical protein